MIWECDQELRKNAAQIEIDLGKRGGHPDVAAWQLGNKDLIYFEYKGPGDSIGPKQEKWIRAILNQAQGQLPYLIVNGIIKT